MTMQSQNDKILDWLMAGHKITPILAFKKFGCFRLSGRIYDLKKYGFPIEMEIREWKGKRFAEYSLPKQLKMKI